MNEHLPPHQRQRIVNTACGYAFVTWTAVTLAWLCLLLGVGLAALFTCMAVLGALLGLPRAIQTGRGRFIWVPAGAIVYLGLAGTGLATLPDRSAVLNGVSVAVLGGMLFSFLTAFNLLSLARHDFAKAIPAWVCRSCGYTLLGLKRPRCPECGAPFDPDRVPAVAQKRTGPDS